MLRDCILCHCFRELDTIDEHEWQNQMSCALKWQEHASRMRLIQSSKEADIQNVELPTWFVELRPRWQAARQSAPDVNGNKPATCKVEFEGV